MFHPVHGLLTPCDWFSFEGCHMVWALSQNISSVGGETYFISISLTYEELCTEQQYWSKSL